MQDDGIALDADELAELSRALDAALAAGDPGDLPMIGAGEISVAVAWPPDEPRAAVKQATCLPGAEEVAAFSQLVARYRSLLAAAGVATVPTAVQCGPGERGFLTQPLLDEGAVAERYVAAEPAGARWVLEHVVHHVVTAVGPTVGLDPQLANWAVEGDRLLLLDVGSPFVRDDDGRDLIDLRPYYASLPAPLRPAVRRIGPGMVAAYHDRRGALIDFAFNLIKAGLEEHCATVVELTRPHLDEPLTVAEIQRAYRSDARLWQFLQAARRADRWWQGRIRRRTYPYLLPPPIDRRLGRRPGD
jgi:hypothetical protein